MTWIGRSGVLSGRRLLCSAPRGSWCAEPCTRRASGRSAYVASCEASAARPGCQIALWRNASPQLLAASRAWHRPYQGERRNPALTVLDEVAAIFTAHGHDGRWGPVGSVGFELATAVPSTTPSSDLDLVLQADEALTRSDAVRLHTELSRLPVRMDVLVETPLGAVALADYAAAPAATLLRTAHGPRLVCDPWTAATARLA